MNPKQTAEQAVGDVVDRLFRVTSDLHHQLAAVAAGYGLTAQQAVLVRSLDDPIPMRVLAEELSCDPSTVTGLVDRIERLGLMERLSDEADRRIRLLALTPQGARVRDEINATLAARTAARWDLGPGELEHLHDLLGAIDRAAACNCHSADEQEPSASGSPSRSRQPSDR